ncbi:hypothetical protein RBB78_20505 [Tunturiibacter empetritectus]|uniref:hypothetical protein n=1 Tax=Tunturiibacter empetritectus TaxID=3069691 RepID=UPI003D9BC019
MVPGLEGFGVFGALADEDAEVVEPDGGEDYVVVVGEGWTQSCAYLLGEGVEAGLMAELVGRVCVGGDVVLDGGAVGGSLRRVSGH